MTVTAGSYAVKRYVYSGAGSYAFTFKVYSTSDLHVQHIDTDGIVTTLVLGTDYTVTLVDGVTGGTCVASYAPTTGTLVLSRDLPIEQSTDFVNNDSFDMDILENTLDKQVLILQQFESAILGTTVTVNWTGDWATGVSYTVNEIAVAADGSWYKCAFDHTAGVFATDLAAGYWIIALDLAAMEANVAATAADVVTTNADVVLTHADVVLTNADVLLTNADVVLTHADVVTTNQDALDTAADVLLTNADVVTTNQDAIDTAADVVLTGADLALTHADVILTHADVVLTGDDLALTNADVVLTHADEALTNADAIATAADRIATAADVVTTNADVVLTNADVVSTTALYDSFDDRYLGAKAVEPTLDNDGASLLTGALYFNTVSSEMKVYSGSAWLDAYTPSTAYVPQTAVTGSAVLPKGTVAQRDATPLSGYMRFNTDEATFEGHDGTEWGAIGGGGGLTWSVVTASTTAEDANGYIVDTSTGTKTLTLPATPTEGMTVGYKDLNGYFGTAALIIDGNGENIQGKSEDLVVNSNNAGGSLVYSDATEGWVLTSSTPMQTIQSKPLLHVQDQKASGTDGGSNILGTQTRTLNTVVTNEIAGASLSSNTITLPAGEYYVEGVCPSYSIKGTQASLSGPSTILVAGRTGYSQESYGGAYPASFSGKFTLVATTDVTVEHFTGFVVATEGLGRASDSGETEIYSDLKIWRLDMDKVYPNLSDPSVALSKPLMHVQDQKPTGTAGGTSVVGDNTRVLNTIVTNEIAGASLSSNTVTLPAGKYYIDLIAPTYTSGRCRTSLYVDGVIALIGTNGIVSGGDNKNHCFGEITLTASSAITVVTYTSAAISNFGLGVDVVDGEIAIFTDLRIWQIDAVTQTLITRQPINQPITGAYTTGDIFGGELEYVDATTFNVKPVSCYSDDLTTALFINATTLVDLGAPAINTIYNAFLVKNSDLSYDVLVDTDVNGANLPGTVSYKRWLGFVLTDASGDIVEFKQKGDSVIVEGNKIAVGGTNATLAAVDMTAILPMTRILDYEVVIQLSLNQTYIIRNSVGDGVNRETLNLSSAAGSQAVAKATLNGDAPAFQNSLDIPYVSGYRIIR